jgi:hypothetical protein
MPQYEEQAQGLFTVDGILRQLTYSEAMKLMSLGRVVLEFGARTTNQKA